MPEPPRILVIDDDPLARELVLHTLRDIYRPVKQHTVDWEPAGIDIDPGGRRALAEAKAAQKRDEKKYGVKLHRYRCRFCDHYHLAKRQREE
jgi:CheY-like chemotaxis protein